ncbi:unnamed protein product [Vitrella brassicaformis CCMP3155]|uniref:Uncharacterized protein n=3 Tax=Vitrella brassicaformis TaxID=1169539 RepID=A0A0G4EQ87_VITBC|nr:unnamed protein product [Vitrella brassicaformis CCMP3155]|eukprot:CEL99606.1 unnamed protein product [Vitrella brassicaformis CCMP3155]
MGGLSIRCLSRRLDALIVLSYLAMLCPSSAGPILPLEILFIVLALFVEPLDSSERLMLLRGTRTRRTRTGSSQDSFPVTALPHAYWRAPPPSAINVTFPMSAGQPLMRGAIQRQPAPDPADQPVNTMHRHHSRRPPEPLILGSGDPLQTDIDVATASRKAHVRSRSEPRAERGSVRTRAYEEALQVALRSDPRQLEAPAHLYGLITAEDQHYLELPTEQYRPPAPQVQAPVQVPLPRREAVLPVVPPRVTSRPSAPATEVYRPLPPPAPLAASSRPIIRETPVKQPVWQTAESTASPTRETFPQPVRAPQPQEPTAAPPEIMRRPVPQMAVMKAQPASQPLMVSPASAAPPQAPKAVEQAISQPIIREGPVQQPVWQTAEASASPTGPTSAQPVTAPQPQEAPVASPVIMPRPVPQMAVREAQPASQPLMVSPASAAPLTVPQPAPQLPKPSEGNVISRPVPQPETISQPAAPPPLPQQPRQPPIIPPAPRGASPLPVELETEARVIRVKDGQPAPVLVVKPYWDASRQKLIVPSVTLVFEPHTKVTNCKSVGVGGGGQSTGPSAMLEIPHSRDVYASRGFAHRGRDDDGTK